MGTTGRFFATSAYLLLTIGIAEADFVGLNIGSNQWQSGNSNPYHYSDERSIDLVDDLDRVDPQQSSLAIIIEHPFPVLPNIRYRGYELQSEAFGRQVDFVNSNNKSVGVNQLSSSVDLSGDDIVLYYQLINNWIDLDMGVDLKRLDGEVTLNGSRSSESVEETIPLLYLSARLPLPVNGFYLGADINTNLIDLGLTDSRAQDSTIMLGYDSGKGLGVEGGYKYFSLDLHDIDTLENDIAYDGVFLHGYYHF